VAVGGHRTGANPHRLVIGHLFGCSGSWRTFDNSVSRHMSAADPEQRRGRALLRGYERRFCSNRAKGPFVGCAEDGHPPTQTQMAFALGPVVDRPPSDRWLDPSRRSRVSRGVSFGDGRPGDSRPRSVLGSATLEKSSQIERGDVPARRERHPSSRQRVLSRSKDGPD